MSAAIPARLRAEFQDQIVATTIELRVSGLVHLFLSFPQRLDPDRLARAARLLTDAEPILGCHFVLEAGHAVWQRYADPDAVTWFVQATAADAAAAIRKTVNSEEPLTGRNLIVRLYSLSDADLLALSVSHAVADGAAAYDCAYRLAALYSALGRDPQHRPEPNLASRDSFDWMRSFTLRHKARTLLRDIAALRHAMVRPIGLMTEHTYATWAAAAREAPAFATHRIGPNTLTAIDRFAQAQGCGRLEVLLAGLARAFAGFVAAPPQQPFRVLLPSNMRRFATATRLPPIRNMAAMASMTFPAAADAPFATTLAGAIRETARLHRGLAGAMNPVAAALIPRLSYAGKHRMIANWLRHGFGRPTPPAFTNVGRLNEGRLRFDGTAPDEATLLGPDFNMPMLLLAGLEYRRTLTLATAFQADEVPPARMQKFLDDIVAQIPLAAAT